MTAPDKRGLGAAPFLRAAGIVLLGLLAVLLVDVPQAEAQTPDVLVKNTGQTGLKGLLLSANLTKVAQGFTTGPDANGYTLGSIGFDFGTIEEDISDAGDVLSATLNAVGSDGDPGDALCTLDDPTSFTEEAVNTFYAPATCPALAASTTYFVVVERVTINSDIIVLAVSSSSSEDGGGAVGWSIDDNVYYFGTTWGSPDPADVLLIEVSGIANSSVLVKNTGQTDLTGLLLSANLTKVAQGFTTGPDANGYTLGSIGFDFGTIEEDISDAGDVLSATLNAVGSDGDPGDALCTLDDPTSFTEEAVNTFYAPATCPALAASTTYFVVVERVTINSDIIVLAVSSSSSEDGGGAVGWSIDDNVYYFGTTWGSPDPADVLLIEVSGIANSSVLVKNTGQTGLKGLLLSANLTKVAQGFTTGPDANGYTLGSIGFDFGTIEEDISDAGDVLSATLNAVGSDGDPGDALCTLDDPTSFTEEAVNTFYAPATCPALAASTTYFVVVERVTINSDIIVLAVSSSSSEDGGGAAGWSIDDNVYYFGTTWGSPDPADVLLIEVSGIVAVDAPAMTVSDTALGLVEGGSATYTVVLEAKPTADVTVDVTGGGDVTVDPTSLTFTAATWDTAQTVTVTAAEDLDTVNDTQTITHAVAGTSASEYVGLSVDSVAVTVNDNDTAGVSVSRLTLSVNEGGSGTYTVRLAFQPTASVTVNVTGGGDVSAGPTSLTFTTTTWDTAQTVTVSAAEDLDTVNDTQTITHAVAGTSASEYVGLSVDSVAVTVNDNDTAGVSVSRSTLSVNEGGSGTYTVRLAFQPTASVTVNVTGGGDVSADPTSLTFTTTTWDTAQTVTVSAAEDLDTVNDTQTITHAVAGTSASEYVGLSVDSVAVTVNDNDDPVVTASFEQGSYTVAEGDNVAVKVKLNKNPERTVTIPLTTINQNGASSGDYSGVPSSVTFQSGETVRSFTFTAARDSVEDDGESVKLGFGTLPAKVTSGATDEATVSITDVAPVVNQPPTVSATAEPNTVYPGGNVVLRGMGSDPDGDALIFSWTSDGGGIFAPTAFLPQTAWIAPATETAHTVNLTLTVTDTDGLSASVTVSVLLEPFPQPNAATDLEANVQEDNTIHLSWTIPSQPSGVTIASVEAQRRMSGGAFSPPSWDTVVTLPASATFTGVSGLAADTEYVFRIRLTTTHGLFADSRYIRVRTLTEAPAPRHFAASWPTQTSITLDWSTVETAAEYKMEYRKDGETEWTRISGDFDHLPSTTDHRQAFGVAAGLDCNTRYDFRLSARGSGETRNDGRRYPSTLFGSYATTSAQTGKCAQEERVTNLLVSVEPGCAILTWTPPSGDRDTGYRVERYSYTDNRNHRSEPETLTEQANRVAARYEDCSAEYRTDGAEHSYSVTALDNNPGPDEEGAFGTAYTSLLRYGTSREPEGPLNVRLTHDTQSSRGLAWDAPRDPWLTTVKTARAGSGPQQVVTDPWTTGYRVERREYRRTEGGGWFLPEYEDEAVWIATMTVGISSNASATGYFAFASDPHGALTQSTFTHPSGSYTVTGLFILTTGGGQLRLTINPSPPSDALEDWVLVVDGRSFPFEAAGYDLGHPTLTSVWRNHGLSWTDGQEVSVQLVGRLDWEALRDETDGDTDTSFTDSEDKGDKQYVYRVWAYNPRGLSLYSWRGDWVFNGGDPGGDPEPAVYIPPSPGLQQGGETPSNTPATGTPAISGAARVGEALTAGTAGIADEDGLTNVSYSYQWTAGGSDIAGATNSTYLLTTGEQGQTIQVKVNFTDDADNQESLTSAETLPVAGKPNTAATGEPTISGTPQVDETLTADTSAISDEDGLTNVSYQYQWIAGGSDISGATGSSYELTSSEQGQTVQVRVTFTDDADNQESLTSAETLAVAGKPNTAATGEPTISGTPQVKQTLTADTSAISDEDGLSNVSYQFQWLRDGADIAGQTNSTYRLVSADQDKTIKVRVTFRDDADNQESLTSMATTAVAAQPTSLLTASFANVPVDHDGSNFTFQLSFSENVNAGYARIRDDAFTVSGGAIASASRKTQGSNQGWNVEVNPTGNGSVTITLPETTDCDASGAICTDDSRKLSHPTSATVAGPPAISVSDATVQEAEGAALVFTATLSHASSRTVTVDYATSDGTAVAGSDYSAASGALTFNAGDTSQTVQVTVLTDSEDESQETLTLTLSNPSQATLDDGTGTGTIENGESSSGTQEDPPAVSLTATFANMPATHNGSAFTFDLTFSEEFGISYVTLRDDAFSVTGGTVNKAKRMTQGSNIGWTITVTPDSAADVTIVLPVTTDCAAERAVCTGGGGKLSNRLVFNVSGPGQ